MNTFLLIILITLLIYACRLSGFIVQPKQTPQWLQTYLHFVPIAVFSALIVPSVLREAELLPLEFIALAIAGLSMWKLRRFDLSIFLGLATLWILSFWIPV